MAVKSLYLKNAAPAGAATSLSLQDGGTAPTGALTATGWTVAKLATPNLSAMLPGTKRASTTFTTADAIPSFVATACWRSETTFNGTFANTNWTMAFRARCSVVSTQTGAIKVRVWRSVNADGTGATQLTSAVLTGTTTAVLATGASATSTVTWSSPGAQRLTDEYLWVQCEWSIVAAAGSNTADAIFYVESAGVITTPDFQPPPVNVCTPSNLTAPTPVLETKPVTQTHALVDVDLIAPAPVLATAALTQAHTLLDLDLVAPAPVFGVPILTEVRLLRIGDRVLDNGLAVLDIEADKMFICSNIPSTYTEAVSTFALGVKNFGVGQVFTSPAAGTPKGRLIRSNAVVGGTVSAAGVPQCWAVVDSVNSRLLVTGPASGFAAVSLAWSWTLGQIPIHMDG